MASTSSVLLGPALVLLGTVAACSDTTSSKGPDDLGSPASGDSATPTNPQDGPPAGYPDGHASVPAAAQAEDVSSPTTVVGTGSAASCTGDAFVAAVAKGGVITVDCGPDPVTIALAQTAKVLNDKGTKL